MAKNTAEKKDFVGLFAKLLTETHQRDHFAVHEEAYYQSMLEKIPQAEILVAFLDDEPLAAGIFTYQKQTAIYYYGASSNQHRELMAPYLLQWTAIREAKKRGCESYDFLGIAPEDAPESHPWRGITGFKQKFGGETLNFPKAVDIVHKSMSYKLYQLLKFIQKLIKK